MQSYIITAPVDFKANIPVVLTLQNTTSGGGVIWHEQTDLSDNFVIGTNTTSDILDVLPASGSNPDGAIQVPRTRLVRGGNSVIIDTDPALGTTYLYPFPATAPTAGDIIVYDGTTNVFTNLNVENTVCVNKNPGFGEFSSIAAAIASIPVFPNPGYPTSTNRWDVCVYAGDYAEPAIVLPEFVYIVGHSMQSVRINPSAMGYTLISMGASSGISFVTIRDTDPTLPACQVLNAGNVQGTKLHKIYMNGCAQGILGLTNGAATATSSVHVEYVHIEDSTTYGLRCADTNILGGFGTNMNIENYHSYEHSDDGIIIDGLNSELMTKASSMQGDGVGNAVRILNGASAILQALRVELWAKGVYVPVSSGISNVLISGVIFDACTSNIDIIPLTTTGNYTGYTEYTKATIPKAAPFFITNQDQRIITVASKGGNFSSVVAALAAITDNGPASRYLIMVGPGIFIENQIVLKDYVTISGVYRTQTVITAAAGVVGTPFVKGAGFAAISNVTLSVVSYATPPSYLIEFLGHASALQFRVDNIIFDSSAAFVHVGSTAGTSIFLFVDNIVKPSAPLTRGIVIEDSGPSNFSIRYTINNFIWSPTAAGLTNFIEMYNIESFKSPSVIPNIFGYVTDSLTSEGLNVPKGTMCTITGATFTEMQSCVLASAINGLVIANSAEISQVNILGTSFINNTTDITVSSPIATGTINVAADFTKVVVNPLNTTVGILIGDQSGAIAIGGPIYQGEQWNKLTNISSQIQHASTTGSIDDQPILASVGGLNISVTGGTGYVFIGPLSDNYLKFVTWSPVGSFALPNNALSYIYVDSAGTVSSSLSPPDHNQNIILGNVKTFGGAIEYVQDVGRIINNLSSNIDQTLRTVFGPIVSSGCIGSPGSSLVERAVAVSSGSYSLSVETFPPTSGDNVSMIGYYGGTSETAPFTNIPLSYDLGGVLTPIPAGQWVKHSLFILSSLLGTVQYFLVFGQQTFASEGLADAGPQPIPPATFVANMCPVSGIVLTDTDPSSPLAPTRFLDIRPTLNFRSTGVSSTSDHNSLLNLTVGNAHPQYFRVDGTEAMAGDIDLAGNNIFGSGGNLLNGVDITAHEARHLPGGADALVTAAPVTIGTANAIGAAASFSRSDHIHNHGAQTDPTQHALVTSLANGFMSSADKIKLDAATPLNTASTIVQRDGSGNFAASVITANDFVAINAASGTQAFSAKVTGDAVVRYNVSTNGDIAWSSGALASDVREYRSATNTLTIDNGVVAGPAHLEVAGNERVGGYEKIGALTTPLNVTTGDLTATRAMIGGTDTTFSSTAGKFMIVNGNDTTSGANSSLGIALAPTFGPTSTLTGTVIGTQLSAMTSSNNAITGSIIGASSVTQLNGSGDVSTPVGMYAASTLTGNSASTHGMLTVTVGSSGGTLYTAGDILNVLGPPEAGSIVGTVTVLTVSGGGAVLTVSVTHPGKGYIVAADYSTSGGTGAGALITVLTRGSTSIGTTTGTIGLKAQGISANGTFVTPVINTAIGILVVDSDLGSGPATLTTQNGIDIQALTTGSGTNTGVVVRAFNGTGTTNLGVDIKAFTATGTTNVGVRIATPSGATNNYALQFVTQSTTPAGGILFGSGADATLANLYRTAAGRVRTDGEFQALHFLCISAIPTVAVGAGAGATGTATIAANSTDAGMQVTVVVSGSLAAAANATIFTTTYASTYSSAAQFVVFSEANAAAAALALASRPFISATTTTTFTFRSNATAIPVGTYIWNFSVRA